MVCPKCGADIKDGHLYCEKCGEEIQIVPVFEAEIEESISSTLSSIKDDIEKTEIEETTEVNDADLNPESADNSASVEELKVSIQLGQRSNRPKKIKLAIVGFVGLIVVGFLIYGGAKLYKFYSYNFQYNKALEEYNNGNYALSLDTLKHALRLNSKEEKAKLLLSDNYTALRLYDESIAVLLELKERFPHDYTVYDRLVANYLSVDDTASIIALVNSSDDENVTSKYSMYISDPPIFDMDEGEYEDSLTLRLFSESEGKIYYTLDGSEPTVESTEYKAPIYMVAGNIVVSAIFVNENGVVSDTVSQKYTIHKHEELVPELNPPMVKTKGGSFNSPKLITVALPFDIYSFVDSDTADYNDSSNPVNEAYNEEGQEEAPLETEALDEEKVRIVYTTDGSEPNSESKEYSQPIPMPLGRTTFNFALIDDKGDLSEIVTETYDLNLVTMFDIPTCKSALQYYLISMGRSDIGFDFKCNSAMEAVGRNMYLFYETDVSKNETGNIYGVDVITGDLFEVNMDSKDGSYTALQMR